MAFGMMKTLLGKNNRTEKSFEFNRKMSISALKHFAELMGTKDLVRVENEYFHDLILHLLSNHPGIIFKGGTALHKFWNAERFSADLDFVGEIPENVLDDLLLKLNQWGYPARIGDMREYGDDCITVKLVIRGIVYLYHHLTIDIFPDSAVNLSPQLKQHESIFPDIPTFSIHVMSPNEALAEKIRTLFSRENPQDLHDVNFLLDIASIDWDLIQKKFNDNGLSFSFDELEQRIINLKRDWENKLAKLLPDVPNFDEVKNRVLNVLSDESIQVPVPQEEIFSAYAE